MRLLLLNGAHATVGASWKTSPLGLATEHRNANVTRIILNHGARFRTSDEQGSNPLLFRIAQGRGRKGRRPYCSEHSCVLKILLTHGVDASAKDASGNEALHLLAGSPSHLTDTEDSSFWAKKMVTLLLDHGANIGAENAKLETPRYIAFEKKQLWLVQTLENRTARDLFRKELKSRSDTEDRQMELWSHPGSIVEPLRIRKRKQGLSVSNEVT